MGYEDITEDDLTPWSISKGQIAQNCSFRFHLQYIQRAPKQTIERPEGRIGSAAHLFVENCLQGMDYKLAFRKAAMSNPMTRNEILELKTFKDNALGFVDRFTQWREKMGVGDDAFFIEKEVAFNDKMEPSEYWGDDTFFRGKWDIGAIVERRGKRYVIIIDHKTGNPPASDANNPLGKYQDQLWSYIASAFVLYPDIAGAQTAINWLREDDDDLATMWGKMVPRKEIQEEVMPWFWRYFDEASNNVMQRPTPNKGWYCDFCAYKYKCPLFD